MKTSEPFFSVVIPTYNRAGELDRCLDSLVRQTYKNFEVIVCDDGSTDNTGQVVDAYGDTLEISHIWEENWGGPARPRNNGINSARGKWVCFLDSDDWWYPEKLQTCHAVASKDWADVIFNRVECRANKRVPFILKYRGKVVKKPCFEELMVKGNTIPTSSVCVRKQLVRQLGGFQEEKDLVAVEDYDLWLRIASVSNRFHFIHEVLGAYWFGDDNISEQTDRGVKRLEEIFNRYKSLLNGPDRVRAESYLCYRTASIYRQMGHKEAVVFFRKALIARPLHVRILALFYMVEISIRTLTKKYKQVL